MVSQYAHISSIFKEYTAESRVLRSFTNLSNTVIQTALSGQSKFVFELLQNADDAYEAHQKAVHVQFIVKDNFFIVHHNGKGFDYSDVERICDYASQIKEVKATDLSKTGYKGLGFKSLFNLSDTIYICSNGYSFRFDKGFWPNPENRPWQVIPIWCGANELPLYGTIDYSFPVNFVLRVRDINKLKFQLKEVVDQPDLLLYLHRINKLRINFDEEDHIIERKIELFGQTSKVVFYKNQCLESTWLTKTYECPIPPEIKTIVRGGSRFIYPEKIKDAKNISLTFALKSNEASTEISKIKGLCYNTLPTQLHLMLPYHINSFFILNLDRTQLHENEWNAFLIEVIGKLQFCLLRDLTPDHYLKNYVISLLVRKIEHPYRSFARAFSGGFMNAINTPFIPSYDATHLLKLGQAWTDEIDFFKQNFDNVYDHLIGPCLIDYDVLDRDSLIPKKEVHCFNYQHLFENFAMKYYPHFTKSSYIDFISYAYEKLKSNIPINKRIRNIPFLVTRNKTLVSPQKAVIEDEENLIPNYLFLNPVDNGYLPQENQESVKDWLHQMGARILKTPCHVIQESVLNWIHLGCLSEKMKNNHVAIIEYLAKHIDQLSSEEVAKLNEHLMALTEKNSFRLAKSCFLPDIMPMKELADVVTKDAKLSSMYDMNTLRHFFIRIGVKNRIRPMSVVQRILEWIKSNAIWKIITEDNYSSIMECIAQNYLLVERNLQESEKESFKNIPILTKGQKLMQARSCFFEAAIPTVQGFENIINANEIVLLNNESQIVHRFLSLLGVSEQMSVIEVMRKSVIQWIRDGKISEKINKENHLAILGHIASQCHFFSSLKQREKSDLRKMLILTKNNTFKPACTCFWPSSTMDDVQIPGIESIISPGELVSSDYDLNIFKETLEYFGVRSMNFLTLYKKYTDHLIYSENVKWFFYELVYYWRKNKVPEDLLSKLKLSYLLAKNRRAYYSKELYSSIFSDIHYMDPDNFPVLAYGRLPLTLEEALEMKTKLSLNCITRLYKAIDKRKLSGEKMTLNFFRTLFEQLKLKSKNEIKKYPFKLFSKKNEMAFAKDLYYFEEEEAECELKECYLKRINGMSHSETLELAKLCNVNVLPFSRKVMPVEGKSNGALKHLCMQRLPFIVFDEAKKRNELSCNILNCLFEEVDSLSLYECGQIRVQYPFGKPVGLKKNFEKFTMHVVNSWKDFETEIYKYLAEILSVETNIVNILDYEDYECLLKRYSWEDQKKIDLIQSELQALQLKKKEELCSVKDVEVREDYSSDDEKVSSIEDSSCEETSDDESLYVIAAKDIAKKTSICEVKGIEIQSIKEKVMVGVKCVDVEETTSVGRDISVDDILKLDSSNFAQNSLTSKDHDVGLSYGGFKSTIAKNETEVSQKETEDDSLIRADHSYLYARNAEIRTSEKSVNDETSVESIFGTDLNENESKMRVCIGRFVFSLLQKRYIRKYPGSRCGLLFNTFTLQWKARRMDIKWLNGTESSNHPYDFELCKDGVIKQFIRVELTEVKDNESFVLSHKNMTMLLNKLPVDDKKCYIFHILRESSSVMSEENNNPAAVYKIIAMQ